MHADRPPVLRRLLAPLGAMLAITAVAGYLVTREPAGPTAINDQPAAATAGVDGRGGQVVEGARPGAATPRPKVPRTAPKPSALYRFLLMQPDRVTPIRWNPCRPVRYRIALNKLAPASEIAHVRAAFSAAGAALGGAGFVYDGTTSVIPDTVDGSAAAGTDVVFAFALSGSGPTRSSLLSGWEAGRGGFAAAGTAGPDGVVVERPTHGAVVVDASKWALMTRHDRTILYLHEIGHVIGLDHPTDGHQIMSSGAYDLPLRYQKGDLAGMAHLGRKAGCAS